MGVIALLSCGHYINSDETPIGYLNDPYDDCPECGTTQLIEHEWPYRFHVNCRDCKMHTVHRPRTYADQSKARHLARSPRHSVTVGYYTTAPPTAQAEVAERAAKKLLNKSAEPLAPPF